MNYLLRTVQKKENACSADADYNVVLSKLCKELSSSTLEFSNYIDYYYYAPKQGRTRIKIVCVCVCVRGAS